MLLISRRLAALPTFVIGVTAVWFFQQPAALSGSFRVVVPPVQAPLTLEETAALPHSCGTLVVSITRDGSLTLNESEVLGSVESPEALSYRLNMIFRERVDNRAYDPGMEYRADLPDDKRILRAVVIKSPLSVAYGDVAKVIDAVRGAGASPVVLQVDELPY